MKSVMPQVGASSSTYDRPKLQLTTKAKWKASDGPRSRFRPQPIGGLRISPRDEALFYALFLNRIMTREQVQTLFFASVPRCNARLRQLFDWGFLTRSYLPTAPFGSQALYSAGKAAIPIIREALIRAGICAEEADIQAQCRRPALSLLEHTLAIGDMYLAARHAAGVQPGIRLEHWLPERLCFHEFEVRHTEAASPSGNRRWRKAVFKPDAFLRLRRADAPIQNPMQNSRQAPIARNYFLEVDRGHTNSRQFAGKLRTHAQFLKSGLFAEVFGWENFQTLVVTTGQKRVENLRILAEQAGHDLFRFTTFEAVERCGILAPIWHAPCAAEAQCLL